MSLYTTEVDACEKYKQAIRDHRDEVESLLYPRPWLLLEKNHCLTKQERKTIESSSGDGKSKVKQLVDYILTKTDIATLSNFSKAVYSKKSAKVRASEIFPFADSLGGIPVSDTDGGKDLPALADKPTVLWLVSSEADCEKVLSVAACTQNGPRQIVGTFSCQEYSVSGRSSRTVHIAYPVPADSASAMTGPVDLLHRFGPRPHLLVMTGTCCVNTRGGAQLGDVCVVRPRTEEGLLMAEIEHMLEVWRLEAGGSLVSEGLRPVPRSVYQQMVCLTRISTELQLSEEERSPWFKGLTLDPTKPLSANAGVRRCVPDPDNLLQSNAAARLWSSSAASPLLHAPCLQLSQEAKSSMLFASQSHSFVSDPPEPRVVFARASRFKQSEGTAVCSPRVADLYKAAVIANNKLESKQSSRQTCGLPYIAALGVSSVDGQDCEEEEYESFANIFSIHIMWKIVNHLFLKIRM